MKLFCCLAVLAFCLSCVFSAVPVLAADATTSLHVVRVAGDRETVLNEVTVSFTWMKDNLPVLGDGSTHYYHQGPVFEGDMWDPEETINLKDKGAVMGTGARDLCDLVGGMTSGDVVRFRATDGWSTEFAYENIYEPLDRQGEIAVCWYNGEDSATGEKFGFGYPGLEGFHSAMQLVFITGIANKDGLYVFGNEDMRVSLPQEEYQHFYEGLPSTNGLSGKWISEIIIYTDEPASSAALSTPAVLTAGGEATVAGKQPPQSEESGSSLGVILWSVIGCGLVGIVLISIALIRVRRKR